MKPTENIYGKLKSNREEIIYLHIIESIGKVFVAAFGRGKQTIEALKSGIRKNSYSHRSEGQSQ